MCIRLSHQGWHRRDSRCQEREIEKDARKSNWQYRNRILTCSLPPSTARTSGPYPTEVSLTLDLQNSDMLCLCKWPTDQLASELIWICTVWHLVCKLVSTTSIKQTDWLTIRSGRGILIYSAWQGFMTAACAIIHVYGENNSGHTSYQNTTEIPEYPWKIQEYLWKTPTEDTNIGFN